MEIRCLKTFIQVAERGNFTKAAEALNYTQSTVSAQIKQLETELNTQLFDRINHTAILTDAGRALLDRAHKIINLVEEVRSTSADDGISDTPVRFAMAPSVCSIMMGSTYLTFHELHPNVFVKILEADTTQMLEMLNRNDIDIAFTVDRRIQSKEYIVVSEKKEAVHFVVSKDSELCGKKNVKLEEILRHPFVLSEKGLSYRQLLDEKLAERGISISPIVEMGNTRLLLELVELGGGISFLPEYVTRKSHDEGKIEYLDIKGFDVDIWRQLIYHKNKWVSPSMKRVLDYCAEVSETKFK